MKRYQLLQEKRENIIKIARKHGAFNILIFGSVARGEDSNDSDIDFLVEMEHGRNLLDRIGLIQDLEDYLGCKVDVATINSLKSLEKLLNNSLLRLEKNILKLLGVKLQGFEIF
jgi:predicted nucleotidyltransferase